MFQKPSIGRIVHYNNGGVVQPAIIVKVWNDTCVNLQVFPDSSAGTLWFTSVLLNGTQDPGSCFWPERV